MRVTRATDYALHALMYMVRHMTLLPLSNKVIARSEGIPAEYLAKALNRLSKAGIVTAQGGRNKGYTLARPPVEINLLEIVEAIEGEPLFAECFLKTDECDATASTCPIFGCWKEATDKVREFLFKTSLADVAWNHPDYCGKLMGRVRQPGQSLGHIESNSKNSSSS